MHSARDDRTPRIDAHQHFWTLSRGDYRWLTPELKPLHRDFGPRDLKPLIAAAEVDATVLVQAADSDAETDFLLSIARETDFVAGVVGWVDLEDSGARRRLAELARQGKFVGVRPMLQDLPDERWVLRPAVVDALRVAAELELRFDALARPQHLPALCELSSRLPALRIVVDHAAKPPLGLGARWTGRDEWRARLGELSENPATCCKLSGLVTEAGADWRVSMLEESCAFLRETFGAARLMWGSDWPVVEMIATYASWRAAAGELTRTWSAAESAELFGGAALRFYGSKLHSSLHSPTASQAESPSATRAR